MEDPILEGMKKGDLILDYQDAFCLVDNRSVWSITLLKLDKTKRHVSIKYTFKAKKNADGAKNILDICRYAGLEDKAIPREILRYAPRFQDKPL